MILSFQVLTDADTTFGWVEFHPSNVSSLFRSTCSCFFYRPWILWPDKGGSHQQRVEHQMRPILPTTWWLRRGGCGMWDEWDRIARVTAIHREEKGSYNTEKPKNSICSLVKWADTAFSLCTEKPWKRPWTIRSPHSQLVSGQLQYCRAKLKGSICLIYKYSRYCLLASRASRILG